MAAAGEMETETEQGRREFAMLGNSALDAVLPSPCPHPDIPPGQLIFEPFIGSWNLVVTWYRADGEIDRRLDGEWHFGRVLEGRAVQDVWIVPSRSQRQLTGETYEYGTSIRFYDADLGAWRSTWVGPQQGALYNFVAHGSATEVVLETSLADGQSMRWRFSDISQDSFEWHNERKVGDRWIRLQHFAASRN